jgi:DNA-binding response OmpR family regulator
MAKILLVDDDDNLLAVVSASLTKDGHQVELCYSKDEANTALSLSSFDIVVLDVALPDGSGFDICRDFRSKGGTTPILMLTGKDTERDKELGLDLGADDYLTKPFGFRELSARLRALLRRGRDVTPQTIEMKGLSIDLNQRRLFRNEQEVRLQPLDYNLLEFFAKHPNQVLTQETILNRVWKSYSESGVEALRASVKRIRKEIDIVGQESLIETLHKIGYTFKPRL